MVDYKQILRLRAEGVSQPGIAAEVVNPAETISGGQGFEACSSSPGFRSTWTRGCPIPHGAQGF